MLSGSAGTGLWVGAVRYWAEKLVVGQARPSLREVITISMVFYIEKKNHVHTQGISPIFELAQKKQELLFSHTNCERHSESD